VLTIRLLAWTAGFIEGEGTFYFHTNKLHLGGGSSPQVRAAQVQREPLDRLRLAFGGKIYWMPKHGKQGIHEWVVNGAPAIGLMLTLYTFMSPRRRDQIRTVIDTWRRRPGTGVSNKNKTHCKKGHPFDASNTLQWKGRKHRLCRICYKARFDEYRRRDRHRLLGPERPL